MNIDEVNFTRKKRVLNLCGINNVIPQSIGQSPGYALCVIHKGKPVYTKMSGYSDLENTIPITKYTNFRLASVSKQFIAVATLILYERKFLCLEDNLLKYFDDFPKYGGEITIYQLLTHMSGIKDYEAEFVSEDSNQIHDEDIYLYLREQDSTYFSPGSKYQYCNSGYCLLRLIIEKVSGQNICDFLEKNIFEPLGMSDSVVNTEGKTVIHNRAYGYSFSKKGWVKTDQNYTSATIGDGGIYSSICDLIKWTESFSSNELLSNVSKDIMLKRSVLTDEGEEVYYGMGVFIKKSRGKDIIYHGGSSIGFRTCVYILPSNKLTIIFLSNKNKGDGTLICEKIAEIFLMNGLDSEKRSVNFKNSNLKF